MQLLAPKVAIEGAQASELALKRRRGGREGVQKPGEVAVTCREQADIPILQEGIELEQIRAVGRERVAREAPLQLQVRQEVEDQPAVIHCPGLARAPARR